MARPGSALAHAALVVALMVIGGCGLVLGLEDPKDRTTSDKGGGGQGGNGGTGGTGGTGATGGSVCTGPSDCPDTGSACSLATCVSGVCGTKNSDPGIACTDNGGKVCSVFGKCVECYSPAADCPATGMECLVASCTLDGKCTTANLVDGFVTASGQTAGDCKSQVCDGMGATKVIDDDTDPQDDANDCTDDGCLAGANLHVSLSPGIGCATNGGKVCGSGTKDGVCVECLKSADCTTPGKPSCDTNNDNFVCVSASCMNAIQDGMETDIDCGGSNCGKCANDLICVMPGDCASGFCDAANLCKPCSGDVDCPAAGYCKSGVCTADEPNGVACTSAAMCSSGNCVDGFCCNAACGGICQACSAAKKGQGLDGACGVIVALTDPDNECQAQPSLSCQTTGSCDGNGACAKWPSGTLCSPPQTCSNSMQLNVDLCDGSGACVDGGVVFCMPYACNSNNTACLSSCSADTDCFTNNYCNSSSCVPKLALGVLCTTGNQCGSNACVDGVCCANACIGTCVACTNAKTGQPNGTCAAVTANTDPDNECGVQAPSTCGTNGFCNGAAQCAKYPAGTVCVASSCSGSLLTNADTCNGNGTCVDNGMSGCAPYNCNAALTACLTSCTTNADCIMTAYCSANTCTAKKGNGVACAANGECASTFCLDGVCCGSAACVQCQTCNGSSPGTCTDIAAGVQDNVPANTCSGINACNGFGTCAKATGQVCGAPIQCGSGFCVDGFCCNGPCNNTCTACSAAKTGGTNGICTPVTAGTDPDGECSGANPNCNGAAACGP